MDTPLSRAEVEAANAEAAARLAARNELAKWMQETEPSEFSSLNDD